MLANRVAMGRGVQPPHFDVPLHRRLLFRWTTRAWRGIAGSQRNSLPRKIVAKALSAGSSLSALRDAGQILEASGDGDS